MADNFNQDLDMQVVNYLLKGLTEELLKSGKNYDGMTLEEIEKSEDLTDLSKALIGGARTKPSKGVGMRSKAGLTFVQRQVTKNGKTHQQGFWVRTDKDTKRAHHRTIDHDKGTQPKNSGGGANDGGLREIFKDAETGQYKPERRKLHKKIIDKKVNECPKPKAGQKPQCILMGGGSASGKSTGLKKVAKDRGWKLDGDNKDFGTIDCDAFMPQLPEYASLQQTNEKSCANMAHYEASDLTTASIKETISEGRNFIWDGTLSNPKKVGDVIKLLREQGYEITLINMTCDIEEAVGRNIKRKATENREVPPKQVYSTHSKNAGAFDQIKGLVDEYHLFDNNPVNGERNFMEIENNKDGVLNEEAKNRFLSKKDKKYDEQAKKDYKKADNKKDRRKEKARVKQEKHDKALAKQREKLRAKAEANVGKSEPMTSLEDFWKSMDNPQDIEEVYKALAGDLEKGENVELDPVGFFESFGIDKDDLLLHRPYPEGDGEEKEEDEDKKED